MDLPEPGKSDREGTRIYFAFPDGVYDYTCQGCQALCCREGLGFSSSVEREAVELLARYPALASTIVAREGPIVRFASMPSGCCFLDDENRCRLEREHGPRLKPGACLLAPFSFVARLGTAFVVSPLFVCPLRIGVPPRPGEVAGSQARIQATLMETGLLDHPNLQAPRRSPRAAASDAEALLLREITFRDACARALGRQRFSDFLAAESTERAQLEAFLQRAAALLEVPLPARGESRDGLDDVLLVLASQIRLALLAFEPEQVVRALALGELLIRPLSSLRQRALTPQDVHHLLTAAGPALRLLARGDAPLEVRRNASAKAPAFQVPEMVFAAFVALREIQSGTGPLAALEKAVPPSMPPSERVALIRYLGERVEAMLPSRLKRRLGNN